ncbi:hypothetical protein MSS2_04710 [Mycobacterium marinum]|nr:hypothetical protein MSS2_04710 [Mycobacterium marinum]
MATTYPIRSDVVWPDAPLQPRPALEESPREADRPRENIVRSKIAIRISVWSSVTAPTCLLNRLATVEKSGSLPRDD